MKTESWKDWSPTQFNDQLDKARLQCDCDCDGWNADEMIKHLFLPENRKDEHFHGRLGYNHHLNLADLLVESPELALIEHSQVRKQLDGTPEEVRDYFDPIPAPDWVDPEQLALASAVWHKNIFPMLMSLYSISLPSCYLIQRGIPALYDTKKLADARYISQRLFETALMLDETMDPGGIRIIEDAHMDHAALYLEAFHNLDPDGHWKREGRSFVRVGKSDGNRFLDSETLLKEVNRLKKSKTQRYLWGRGYISARKVRALHVSMRFMLLNPDLFHNRARHSEKSHALFSDELKSRSQAWDTAKNGMPINQEDMAFTLLTFAYLLPSFLQMNKRLPALMIIDQGGMDQSGLILEKKVIEDAMHVSSRFLYGLALCCLRIRFWTRDYIFNQFPILSGFVTRLLHQSGEAFYMSFRDAYLRRPFYIPKTDDQWELAHGTSEDLIQDIHRWRHRLFNMLLSALVGLVVTSVGTILLIITILLDLIFLARCIGAGLVMTLCFSLFIMKWRLPKILLERPGPRRGSES